VRGGGGALEARTRANKLAHSSAEFKRERGTRSRARGSTPAMQVGSTGKPSARAGRRWIRALEILLAVLMAPVLVAVAARKLHGKTELVRVGDDQVAVILDRWSGAARTTSVPGFVLRLPWLQEITLLQRSPGSLVIGALPKGTEAAGANPAAGSKLLVRARDGSSFRVEQVVVQYAIVPEAAATVLDELGPGAGAAPTLLAGHVRSILRDEFGRVSAEETSRGEKMQDVQSATAARLQAAVAPHGIAILGVTVAKPEFDSVYEDTIERTKTFRQQADELAERTEQAERGRAAREAAVGKKKEVELAKLEGDLVRDRGLAVRDARLARQEADDFYRAQASEGEAARRANEAQAAIVKARNVAAAREVLRDGVELELAGELPVRKALVEKLGQIQIDLVPRPREAGVASTVPASGSKTRP
jgi:hypothetical protein